GRMTVDDRVRLRLHMVDPQVKTHRWVGLSLTFDDVHVAVHSKHARGSSVGEAAAPIGRPKGFAIVGSRGNLPGKSPAMTFVREEPASECHSLRKCPLTCTAEWLQQFLRASQGGA